MIRHGMMRSVASLFCSTTTTTLTRLTTRHTLLYRYSFSSTTSSSNDGIVTNKRTSLSSSPSPSSSSSPVLLQQQSEDGSILTLTLNRPKQRNALNFELIQSLHDILQNVVATSKEIRVVIIQSNGPVFCSGHDLKELLSLLNTTNNENCQQEQLEQELQQQLVVEQSQQQEEEEKGNRKEGKRKENNGNVEEIFQLCGSMMQLLHTIPQPTICAVQGLATAAGCQLVAACDIVVASSSSAKFCTPGIQINLFCHTPAVELVRCIGMKRTLDMLYTGRIISAVDAFDYGLVSRLVVEEEEEDNNNNKDESVVVDDDEKNNDTLLVHKESYKLAKDIVSRSSYAIQLGKQTFYQQVSTSNIKEAYTIATSSMVKNINTIDTKHGIQSFLSSRTKKT